MKNKISLFVIAIVMMVLVGCGGSSNIIKVNLDNHVQGQLHFKSTSSDTGIAQFVDGNLQMVIPVDANGNLSLLDADGNPVSVPFSASTDWWAQFNLADGQVEYSALVAVDGGYAIAFPVDAGNVGDISIHYSVPNKDNAVFYPVIIGLGDGVTETVVNGNTMLQIGLGGVISSAQVGEVGKVVNADGSVTYTVHVTDPDAFMTGGLDVAVNSFNAIAWWDYQQDAVGSTNAPHPEIYPSEWFDPVTLTASVTIPAEAAGHDGELIVIVPDVSVYENTAESELCSVIAFLKVDKFGVIDGQQQVVVPPPASDPQYICSPDRVMK